MSGDDQCRVRYWYGKQRIDTGYLVARDQRLEIRLGGGVGSTRFKHRDGYNATHQAGGAAK